MELFDTHRAKLGGLNVIKQEFYETASHLHRRDTG